MAPDSLDKSYGVKRSEEDRKEKKIFRMLSNGKVGVGG